MGGEKGEPRKRWGWESQVPTPVLPGPLQAVSPWLPILPLGIKLSADGQDQALSLVPHHSLPAPRTPTHPVWTPATLLLVGPHLWTFCLTRPPLTTTIPSRKALLSVEIQVVCRISSFATWVLNPHHPRNAPQGLRGTAYASVPAAPASSGLPALELPPVQNPQTDGWKRQAPASAYCVILGVSLPCLALSFPAGEMLYCRILGPS